MRPAANKHSDKHTRQFSGVLVMLVDFLSTAHLAALLPIDAEATVRTLQAQLLALW